MQLDELQSVPRATPRRLTKPGMLRLFAYAAMTSRERRFSSRLVALALALTAAVGVGGVFIIARSAMWAELSPSTTTTVLDLWSQALLVGAMLSLTLPVVLGIGAPTWRAFRLRRVLREGDLASAEIVSNTRASQGSRAVVARVELPDGDHFKRSWTMPSYAPGAQAEVGEQLQALVGLGLRPEVILPSWVGARFAVPADIRPAAWPMPDIPAPRERDWMAALYDQPPVLRARRGWFRRLKPSATLHLRHNAQGAQLTLTRNDGTVALLDLERPFRIDLSVWLLPDGRTDVTLGLRAEDHANATDAPLRLKVRLAQSAVARHLPLQETQAPYLDPTEFAQLWDALVYHSHLHGRDLRRDLKPSVDAQAETAAATDATAPQDRENAHASAAVTQTSPVARS